MGPNGGRILPRILPLWQLRQFIAFMIATVRSVVGGDSPSFFNLSTQASTARSLFN